MIEGYGVTSARIQQSDKESTMSLGTSSSGPSHTALFEKEGPPCRNLTAKLIVEREVRPRRL